MQQRHLKLAVYDAELHKGIPIAATQSCRMHQTTPSKPTNLSNRIQSIIIAIIDQTLTQQLPISFSSLDPYLGNCQSNAQYIQLTSSKIARIFMCDVNKFQ